MCLVFPLSIAVGFGMISSIWCYRSLHKLCNMPSFTLLLTNALFFSQVLGPFSSPHLNSTVLNVVHKSWVLRTKDSPSSFCIHIQTFLNACVPQTFVAKYLLHNLVKIPPCQCKQATWMGQKCNDVFRSRYAVEKIGAANIFAQPVSFAQISHCYLWADYKAKSFCIFFLITNDPCLCFRNKFRPMCVLIWRWWKMHWTSSEGPWWLCIQWGCLHMIQLGWSLKIKKTCRELMYAVMCLDYM